MENDPLINENAMAALIKERLPKYIAEVFEKDYSNPLKDAVEEVIKENDGQIKRLVRDVFSEVLNTDSFKSELVKAVTARIVSIGLSGR